jgi:hypothetical protein
MSTQYYTTDPQAPGQQAPHQQGGGPSRFRNWAVVIGAAVVAAIVVTDQALIRSTNDPEAGTMFPGLRPFPAGPHRLHPGWESSRLDGADGQEHRDPEVTLIARSGRGSRRPPTGGRHDHIPHRQGGTSVK